LDENEREIAQEVPEEQPPEEAAEEEQLPEEGTEEEQLPEEPTEEPKPAKPIKGPRAGGWIAAVLAMLFGLMMLVPAMWNTWLAAPAVGGLLNEAGKRYQGALSIYQYLYDTDARTQGWGLGLTSGYFTMERQYAIWGRLYGPLRVVEEQDAPPIAEFFGRVPRSLRKLAAQCDIITGIYDSLRLILQAPPEEGQSDTDWLLAGLEAARGADAQAQAHRLYYDAIALHFAADDPGQREANLARFAALKKDPAAEPWMYEDAELGYAVRDRDYAAVTALCEARLKRNPEDGQAMRMRVKAIFLEGDAKKAFAAADGYARRPAARDAMLLARADLLCAQGGYDEALRLCDDVLGRVTLDAPEGPQDLYDAMEAARVKAGVLLVMGSPGEARDLLKETWDVAGRYGLSPGADYIHTLLAAYIEAGDTQEADELLKQLNPVPQGIADLREGKTTVREILTKGWGGFDA